MSELPDIYKGGDIRQFFFDFLVFPTEENSDIFDGDSKHFQRKFQLISLKFCKVSNEFNGFLLFTTETRKTPEDPENYLEFFIKSYRISVETMLEFGN